MKMKTQKLTFLAVFSAFAIVLSFVESLLPPIWSSVPGVKMGLPNIVIIFLLYKFSVKEAAAVSFIRILVIAFLFGNFMTLIYSLSGAVLSISVMWIMKKSKGFSMVGVSIAGGVFHNIGQIITAIIILGTKEIGFYLPVLAASGTVAGIFIGFGGILLIKYTGNYKF